MINKKYIEMFSVIVIIFWMNSCCHKKDCNAVYAIQFKNFENIDSLTIITYVKNSHFDQPIDTLRDKIIDKRDTNQLSYDYYLSQNNPANFDYKIQVDSIPKEFLITELTEVKKICNECIVGNDFYESLKSCKVNGILQEGMIIDK